MQVYLVWKDLPSGLEMPKLQLVAFQRVPLYAAAGAVRVEGNFKVSQLKVLNQQDSFVYLPGWFMLHCLDVVLLCLSDAV